jgi:hypothetical protein
MANERDIEEIQSDFAYLHKWLKEKYKLSEPALSQVAASLVQSSVMGGGIPVTLRTGAPLELGFISSDADGELHGSLSVSLDFTSPLSIESEL